MRSATVGIPSPSISSPSSLVKIWIPCSRNALNGRIVTPSGTSGNGGNRMRGALGGLTMVVEGTVGAGTTGWLSRFGSGSSSRWGVSSISCSIEFGWDRFVLWFNRLFQRREVDQLLVRSLFLIDRRFTFRREGPFFRLVPLCPRSLNRCCRARWWSGEP